MIEGTVNLETERNGGIMLQALARMWIGGLAGGFGLLALAGLRLSERGGAAGVLASHAVQKALGFAGWGLVAAGFLGVVLVTVLKNRPRPRRRLIPVEAGGQEPEKMVHSEVYTPPPYRLDYRSTRRRR